MDIEKFDAETVYVPKDSRLKDMACRAENCRHRPDGSVRCGHEWVELDDYGMCIFYTRRTIVDYAGGGKTDG